MDASAYFSGASAAAANDNGQCACMCSDCSRGDHGLCDNGTCGDNSWLDWLREEARS